MALFSASESVYLSSFLSSVDLDSSVNHDGSVDPTLADQIPHIQGSEALAKATKDLMSLDVPPSAARGQLHAHAAAGSPPSYWPSFPSGEQPAASSAGPQGHPFAQDGRSSSPAHFLHRGHSGSITAPDPLRSGAQGERMNSSIFTSHLGQQQPHVQIAPLRGFDGSSSSSAYNLPPISTSGFPNGLTSHDGQRPSAGPSAVSAPSVLTSSTKRPLPASSEPATDPSSSKRARPSPSSTSFPSAPGADSASTAGSSSSTRPRHNSSATQRRGTPATERKPRDSLGDKDASRDREKDEKDSKANGAGASKGALLSPSQKRANHIQSEQKRRANIRRGYEALCEVVPALREAIRAEEERERAEADDDAKGKGRASAGGAERGKKKRKSESEKADGRAGPRSENVVLSKTIDYITDLLADRDALTQRLQIARGILPLGHPAAHVDPRHTDAQGTALWEREWDGGMNLDIGPGDDGSEDEG